MSKIIGVEQSLSNIEDALKAKGYEVIQLRNEEDAKSCDACVITGQDRDVMGISDPVMAGILLMRMDFLPMKLYSVSRNISINKRKAEL